MFSLNLNLIMYVWSNGVLFLTGLSLIFLAPLMHLSVRITRYSDHMFSKIVSLATSVIY